MSMQEEFFTAALGLQHPWSVQKIEFDPEAGQIDFHVAYQRGSHFDCPACSEPDKPVHDTKSRRWRHLNFFQSKAFITASVPRTRCSSCGKTSTVPVPWARAGLGFTLMFEAFALTLAREMPVNAVARTFGADDDSLWRIINHHTDKARAIDTNPFYHRPCSRQSSSSPGASPGRIRASDQPAGRQLLQL